MKEHSKQNDPAAGSASPPARSSGKKWVWNVIFVLVAAVSIWAVASQGRGFSPAAFWGFVSHARPHWILAAVLAMLGFIVFEAFALRGMCGALGHPIRLSDSSRYAAADIYFSAITPSATGGQPAAALLMMRGGLSGMVTTSVLLLNVAMYSLAILAIGLLCLVLRPGVFFRFGTVSRVLIVVGYAAQLGLAFLFLLLIRSKHLLERLCAWALRLLGRMRLLRDKAKWQDKLRRAMDEYRQCAVLFAGQRWMLVRTFLFNLLQRASQIAVTMLVFLAMGGSGRQAADIWAMQSYVVIGSNCVPVPGAMGVADYLMLDGFGSFLPEQAAVDMELLSRALSFYCCILICGVMVLLSYRKLRQKGLEQ